MITSLDQCYTISDKGQTIWDKANLAQYLINELYIINVRRNTFDDEGCIYSYDKKTGLYTMCQVEIERLIQECNIEANIVFRKEVLALIKIYAPDKTLNASYERYIACRNGLYDLIDNKLKPFSPDIVLFSKLDTDYLPNPKVDNTVEKLLNNISVKDKAVRLLLEESIGYSCYRSLRFQKCFILTGEGSNGKSTFFNMLKAMFGLYNVAALSIAKMGEKFAPAILVNKYINICDDISNNYIKDTEVFKTIVCGGVMQIEKKFKDAQTVSELFATTFIAGNEIPQSADKSDGYYRRFIIIPFKAKFSPADNDYDPYIEEKLKTDQAKSYLLSIAIRALQRIIMLNGFDETDESIEAKKQYIIVNDPVSGYLSEHDRGWFVEKSTTQVFENYNDWYHVNYNREQTTMSFQGLTRKIKTATKLETKQRCVGGEMKRFYVPQENGE